MVRYKKPAQRSDSLQDRRGSPGRKAMGLGGGGVAILIARFGSSEGLGDFAGVLEGLQPIQTGGAEAALEYRSAGLVLFETFTEPGSGAPGSCGTFSVDS